MPSRKKISLEDKQKIVKLYHEEYRMTDIARIMDLNIQTVSRIIHKFLKEGEITNNSSEKVGPHNKKLTAEQLEIVKSWVDEASTSLKKIS